MIAQPTDYGFTRDEVDPTVLRHIVTNAIRVSNAPLERWYTLRDLIVATNTTHN